MFTLRSKAYEGRYLEVACEQIPNVESNTSEIQWTLTVAGGEYSWYSTGPTTLTIGGQQVYYCKRKSYSAKVFPAAKGSVSGKLTVDHDENGNCTLDVSLETAIYTATLSTVAEHWELAPIQRASRIRASDANIGSCATVVVGRGSSNFTHTIAYRFGTLSGWLNALGDPVTQPVRHGETTLNFLLPEVFYEEISNSPRGSCELVCTTYRGDEVMGESSCTFAVAADPELCRPVVTAQMEPGDDLTLSLNFTKMIPGFSTALCRVEATARKGASLVSVTAGEEPVQNGQVRLPGWDLSVVPIVAVDSRGYETRLELPCSYVDYVQPTNLSEVVRPEPTADSAVVTLRGRAFRDGFEQTENYVEAVIDFDSRQLTVPLPLNEAGEFSKTVELEGLSYTKNYPVTVTIRDLVTAAPRDLTVRKGIPVFDWGESDFRFHVPVILPDLSIGGINIADYIRLIIEGGTNEDSTNADN